MNIFFGIKEFYNDKSKNKIIISKNKVLNVIKEFNIYDINNNYIKSVYRWRITDNPILPEINSNVGEIKWKDSNQYKLTFKNKDISENKVYQLEANFFNWLSIPNELETNNIPSLIPAEIKLSDGEYGKYLTNLIVSDDKIEEYLNYFSQENNKIIYSKQGWTKITSDLANDDIKIIFKEDEKISTLNKIEISGIWGYGNYDITIFTEINEKIIQGKDATLELLQSLPIGTNIVEEIKKTEPTAINFKLVENNKWDVRIKDNISTFSNNVLFLFLNTNLERNKMFSISFLENINININNLQLFNKNNEKLSLITLEI